MRAWVLTENAHHLSASPFEPFPDKQHLYILTKLFEREKRLLVPKTRQITASWLFCALHLHDALFFPSRLTFIQSQKEEHADELLERCHSMYQKLPEFMKLWQPVKRTHCVMRFSRNRSRLIAVPEGPEHVRSFTPTRVFVDEAAFQDNVEKMLAAILPALGTKGALTMVSSASHGFFKMLCFDEFTA